MFVQTAINFAEQLTLRFYAYDIVVHVHMLVLVQYVIY